MRETLGAANFAWRRLHLDGITEGETAVVEENTMESSEAIAVTKYTNLFRVWEM